jgi:hypothetical protein
MGRRQIPNRRPPYHGCGLRRLVGRAAGASSESIIPVGGIAGSGYDEIR